MKKTKAVKLEKKVARRGRKPMNPMVKAFGQWLRAAEVEVRLRRDIEKIVPGIKLNIEAIEAAK